MRGRKAECLEGLGQYDFDKLATTSGSARERRRYLAFAHIAAGESFVSAAAAVRVNLRSLMRWIQNFRKEGLEGLQDKPGRGAKPYMSSEQRMAFKHAVLELQQTSAGGRLRGKDIREFMKKKYGIYPSLSTIYNTLKTVDLGEITTHSHTKSGK